MYRSLIVPLDGALVSEQALPCAALIAAGTGASVHLVRVHQSHLLEPTADREWEQGVRADEEDYLARAAAYLQLEVACEVTHTLLDGPTVEAICGFARERREALIVMSTHGRTGFRRVWFGSVADGVIHHTSNPVLLVRPPREGTEPTELALPMGGRILVPLDGSDFAEQVLPHAVALAEATDGELFLLQVVQPVPPAPQTIPVPYLAPQEVLGTTTRAMHDRADQYLSTIARSLRIQHAPLTVEYGVQISDNPATAIIECVHARSPEAVALATHGRGMSRLIVGSVADSVLRAGPRVVLLLRPTVRESAAVVPMLEREADIVQGGVEW